jgi:glycosyltransferase involved in cell wall biosynthesis
MRKSHVAFVNTHPIQYFGPLYANLNASDDIAITALYLSDYSVRGALDRSFGQVVKWNIDLLSGYDARFVSGASRRDERLGFWSVTAPAIWNEVCRGKFDAIVVHGHTPAAMLLAVAAAKWARTPVFMRAETHLGLRRSGLKRATRRIALSNLYRQLSGVLAIGSANAAFYRAMGVPESKIFSMPYTVDNERFMRASRLSTADRLARREALGVHDDRPVVLYAAKLQRRKRPDDLIRAAARLSKDGMTFHLAIVGSGEMQSELSNLVAHLALKNVQFCGFVNQRALPTLYGAADIFVLPSEDEPWGLTVNEAMCAGLPIIASNSIGCVPDLVRDGENGRVFPAGDVASLADAILDLVLHSTIREAMGKASIKIISQWSYAECHRGLRAALASVNHVPNAGSAHNS